MFLVDERKKHRNKWRNTSFRHRDKICIGILRLQLSVKSLYYYKGEKDVKLKLSFFALNRFCLKIGFTFECFHAKFNPQNSLQIQSPKVV